MHLRRPPIPAPVLHFRTFCSSSVLGATAAAAAHADLSFPTHPRPSPHEIFHLPPTASPDEIKHRYYELVRLHHPDSPHTRHTPARVRDERFKSIALAYEHLKRGRGGASVLTEELRRRGMGREGAEEWVRRTRTRREGFAYRPPRRERERGYGYDMAEVGEGEVFLFIVVLATAGSLALFFSPASAFGARHREAALALAEARREGRENAVRRREEMRRWVEEGGLEGARSEVGRGRGAPCREVRRDGVRYV